MALVATEDGSRLAAIKVGDLCWSTLHDGDERIYRVIRIFASPRDQENTLAEIETVLKSDLTKPKTSRQKPLHRGVCFLIRITQNELSRRIDTLAALRQAIGDDDSGIK